MNRDDYYFSWLCEQIEMPDKNRGNYFELLQLLYHAPFYWTVPMDANRAADGIALRDEFCSETTIYARFFMPDYCTVLEMIVALLRRSIGHFFYADEDPMGPNTASVFWQMMRNCNLDVFTDDVFDEAKAEEILEKVLNREYQTDGKGGFFVANFVAKKWPKSGPLAMNEIELWYQMSIFIEENYGF